MNLERNMRNIFGHAFVAAAIIKKLFPYFQVELSQESGFIKGMKLEVPNKGSDDTYWVASVVLTCGQLLRLRYDGYEDDKTADFWCDLMTSEIHPIGWCAQNNQVLQPPEGRVDKVQSKCNNLKASDIGRFWPGVQPFISLAQ